MVLSSTAGAGIQTYQIAGTNASRIIPDWLIKKRKKTLKYDPEFANRLELIQDFFFEEASNRIKVSRDGQFCMATGTYKPQIHVYDFNELSMKFDRHTDAENVDFEIVSDDWTKSVHLQNDRSIELHAQGGIHHRTRIPRFGRAIVYNAATAEAIVGAAGNEVYRLNLDQGRYMAPFETETEGVNALHLSPAHGLLGCGMEDGTVEFWDPRSRQRAAAISVGGDGVTAVKFRKDGLNFACGTEDGTTKLFDMRSPEALITKDQGYGFAVKNIEWIDTRGISDKILTADKRIVKIWDTCDGQAFTSFEPSVDINDVAVVEESGMVFLANEGKPMHAYYIPAIGPAPKWCSYLDNITEENEEKNETSVYENFKFVTRKELSQLNLGHLIGSNVVKSYMHGYFIHKELYDRARSIANPFAYREHREREIRKKIDEKQESRIRTAGAVGAKVKVNKGLAAESTVAGGAQSSLTTDSRFSQLFTNPEFAIDEQSKEYASKVKSAEMAEAYEAGKRGLTAVEQEQFSDSEEDGSSSSESENEKSAKQKAREKKKQEQEERRKRQLEKKKLLEQAAPEMKAVRKRGENGKSFGSQLDANADFEEREALTEATTRKYARGDVELSYVPQKVSKKPRKVQEDEEEGEQGGNSGRKKQRHGDIRRASKNAFRGM